jgi:hypothetical protein
MSRNPTGRRAPPKSAWSFDSDTSFVASQKGVISGAESANHLSGFSGRVPSGTSRPRNRMRRSRPGDGPLVPAAVRQTVHFQIPKVRSAAVRALRFCRRVAAAATLSARRRRDRVARGDACVSALTLADGMSNNWKPEARSDRCLPTRGYSGVGVVTIQTHRRPYEPKSNRATGSASVRLEFRQ